MPNKMLVQEVTTELDRNRKVLVSTLTQIPDELIHWKNSPNDWSLLEIVCHLVDEEVQDFRARVLHTLKNPELPLVPIDPIAWVTQHDYAGQNFHQKVKEWEKEREASINILKENLDSDWQSRIDHPQRGEITAYSFLCNWLAHDYHHIRQINRIKYNYLKHKSGDSLSYAGNW